MKYKEYTIYEETVYGVITPQGKGIETSLDSIETAKKRIDQHKKGEK